MTLVAVPFRSDLEISELRRLGCPGRHRPEWYVQTGRQLELDGNLCGSCNKIYFVLRRFLKSTAMRESWRTRCFKLCWSKWKNGLTNCV